MGRFKEYQNHHEMDRECFGLVGEEIIYTAPQDLVFYVKIVPFSPCEVT